MNRQHAIRMIWFLLMAIVACCAEHVHAAPPVLLRTSLDPSGPVMVGERVTIRVDLLTTTMFASAPVFELPTIPGALLMQLEDRPVLGTEQIGAESYTVQHHELALFVMRPGVAQVPPFIVRFESPPKFAEKAVEHRLTAPALEVDANPESSSEASAPVVDTPGRQWLWWILGAGILLAGTGVVCWWKRQALLMAWKHRQAAREASEPGQFAQLLHVCHADEAKQAYNALLRWPDATHRGPDSATLEDFLRYHPDPNLRRQVEALQQSILGRPADWKGPAWANALRRTDGKQLPRRIAPHKTQLPSLNPPWVNVLLIGALLVGVAGRPTDAGAAVDSPTYVGGQACVACHLRQRELWKGSDHALAMQAASSATVLGDFNDATFEKDGVTSTFFRRDGAYFVRTDGPDGQLYEYKIAYTFGVDPLQQYLVAFPNGRYQALSIAWDSRPGEAGGQRWFHLYPHEKIDHRDMLHWTGQLQNWNSMCADCHSTSLQKNYRLAEDRYETTWTDIAVSCEACHGPGSRHVEWAQAEQKDRSSPDPGLGLVAPLKGTTDNPWTFLPGEGIARRLKPLSSRAEVETCTPCHARRARVWGDDQPSQPAAQSYRLALLDESLYHADGQIHDEVYEYGSFLQSKMYQAGVTCSDCHDPHSGRLRAEGNALCAQCHLPAAYDASQHHFHKVGTEAAQCVSCHMIKRFYMVIDGRRDHSFRVPRPDLSVQIGTPNACTDCHAGRTAQWATDAVAHWYGPQRKAGWHYGVALDAGRHARADAERLLTRTAADTTLSTIVRATALSLLPRYLGRQSLEVVESSLRDSGPLVRRAAVSALSAVEPRARVSLGIPLLRDPIRTVRLEAVSSLVDAPRRLYTSEQLATLDQVIAEYRQAQAFNADRAEAHLNLGTLDARLGIPEAAEAAYRTAIRLQPAFMPAYINLADLYRQQGREDQVVQTLREALQNDPENGAAHHALGLSLVRQQRLRDAIPELAKAAELRPDLSRYAYVSAVALHESGQFQQALQVLNAAHQRHPADRDILAALVEYHRQAGDRQGAIGWARKLVELSPGDAQARRLLESLQRQP
jgi:predicted CXXCH cytochrome family protein